MAWMTLMKRALDEGVSPENFGKFLIAFNDMKEIKVNDTDWIEIEQDKHTKDKKVIQQKIDYLHTLLVDFLHIKENKPNEDAEAKVSKTHQKIQRVKNLQSLVLMIVLIRMILILYILM